MINTIMYIILYIIVYVNSIKNIVKGTVGNVDIIKNYVRNMKKI